MSALLPAPPTPHLSVGLVSYAAEAPPDWNTLLETVRMYDRAGIDRISISDHVVMGEHIDAYGNPATGGNLLAGRLRISSLLKLRQVHVYRRCKHDFSSVLRRATKRHA